MGEMTYKNMLYVIRISWQEFLKKVSWAEKKKTIFIKKKECRCFGLKTEHMWLEENVRQLAPDLQTTRPRTSDNSPPI